MSRLVLSIPLKCFIKERKSGKMTLQSTLYTRTKFLEFYTLAKKTYSDSEYTYECKVVYSAKQDSWNQFAITSLSQLKEVLDIDLEIDMLKLLLKGGLLDKKYMRAK